MHGVSILFQPIIEERRLADLEAAILEGNHKLALTRTNLLKELVCDNISMDFELLIPIRDAY